jgi:hypothetical protein
LTTAKQYNNFNSKIDIIVKYFIAGITIVALSTMFQDCESKGMHHATDADTQIDPITTDSVTLKICDLPDPESSEGGEIKGYFIDSTLVKMTVQHFGEFGKVNENYDDLDKTSFVFNYVYLFYDQPIYEGNVKVADTVSISGRSVSGRIEYVVRGNKMSKKEIQGIVAQIPDRLKKYIETIVNCLQK